jgi:hypothetical protein
VKFAVYFLLALGIATISFAILRFTCVTVSLVGVAVPMSTPSKHALQWVRQIRLPDGLTCGIVLWGTLECNMGLVIASLPALAPYFTMLPGKAKEHQIPELKSARLGADQHDASSEQAGTLSDLGSDDRSRRGRSMRSGSTAGLVWTNASDA